VLIADRVGRSGDTTVGSNAATTDLRTDRSAAPNTEACTLPTTPSTRPFDGQHDIARHRLLPQSVADEALRDKGAVRRQVQGPGQVGGDRPV
jgi:hypothetical protein